MNNRISENLVKIRKQNNLSQKDLAIKLCVSDKTISKWECGKATPDVEILSKLSEEYGYKIDDIINGDIAFTMPQKPKKKNLNNFINFIKLKRVWISFTSCFVAIILSLILIIPNLNKDKNNDNSQNNNIVDKNIYLNNLTLVFDEEKIDEWSYENYSISIITKNGINNLNLNSIINTFNYTLYSSNSTEITSRNMNFSTTANNYYIIEDNSRIQYNIKIRERTVCDVYVSYPVSSYRGSLTSNRAFLINLDEGENVTRDRVPLAESLNLDLENYYIIDYYDVYFENVTITPGKTQYVIYLKTSGKPKTLNCNIYFWDTMLNTYELINLNLDFEYGKAIRVTNLMDSLKLANLECFNQYFENFTFSDSTSHSIYADRSIDFNETQDFHIYCQGDTLSYVASKMSN